MVSRETILVYVKKYHEQLLILAVVWIITVGATITTVTLLMSSCDQTPISLQPPRATEDYTFNWSEWCDEVITGVRGRKYYG